MSEQIALLSAMEDGLNSQPDVIAESNETREEIYNRVKALSQRTQETMFLYLFGELSHPEHVIK